MPAKRPLYDARSVPSAIAIETSASDSVPLNRSARERCPPPVSVRPAAVVPVPSTWKCPESVPAYRGCCSQPTSSPSPKRREIDPVDRRRRRSSACGFCCVSIEPTVPSPTAAPRNSRARERRAPGDERIGEAAGDVVVERQQALDVRHRNGLAARAGDRCRSCAPETGTETAASMPIVASVVVTAAPYADALASAISTSVAVSCPRARTLSAA